MYLGVVVQREKFSDTNPRSPCTKIVLQILFWDSFQSKQKEGERLLWFLRGRFSTTSFRVALVRYRGHNNIPRKECRVSSLLTLPELVRVS